MVQPVTLMDDRLDALRQGEAVRVAIPELGGEVVMILAAPGETTEQVLEETLQDIREKKAIVQYANRVLTQTIRDDQAG